MNLSGLLKHQPKFIANAFDPNLVTIKDVTSYLNNHRFSPEELQIINPDTNHKSEYKIRNDQWRTNYDPETMEMLWEQGYSYILHSVYINKKVKKIASQIEKLNFVSCDAHVYCGKKNSQSFPPHSDSSYNLIVQCVGESIWRVWSEVSSESGRFPGIEKEVPPSINVVMRPGDAIFVPVGQIHQAQPLTDRISVSFPFLPGPKSVHRNIKLSWE